MIYTDRIEAIAWVLAVVGATAVAFYGFYVYAGTPERLCLAAGNPRIDCIEPAQAEIIAPVPQEIPTVW